MSSVERVHVQLDSRGYDIAIGPGALAEINSPLAAMHAKGARRAFIVVDTGVPRQFMDQILAICKPVGLHATTAMVTPTESIKTIATYENLLTQIATTGHSRLDPVIALGGGIVGDLSGFVAATYRRGVPVIQCPTTLLSMVDASVGGKTGVNLQIPDPTGPGNPEKLLKNLVGAFWQPAMVIADINTLDSLEERQRRAGLSECIKHGYLSTGVGHEGFLDWMIEHLDHIANFEPGIMTQFVRRNVAIKATVVASDEREDLSTQGGRMLLNLGHTFGHAIETIAHLSPDPADPSKAPLHHGEAVALGMIAACSAAEAHSGLDPSLREELVALLNRIGLPTSINGLPENHILIERMGHDKKATAGSVRVIFPTGRGKCAVIENASASVLGAGFDAIRA